MKIGVLLDDSMVHFTPPVLRSLKGAAEKISCAGHEVIELGSDWAILHRRAAQIAFKMYTEEGGIGLRMQLEKTGEPLIARVCTGWSETPLTPIEIWENHRDRRVLRREFLKAYNDLGLDAILTAPMPHPAPPHGQYNTSAICAAYNTLDVPVVVVPHGQVNLDKDVAPEEWYNQEPYPDMANFPYDRYDKNMKEL